MPYLSPNVRRFLPSCILVAVALTYNLGGYPLLDPDEGRNGEVAREMAESNAYLVPTLNGLPYIDKPVLHFAATALSIEIFGHAEWAVRLPSLLFTLFTLGIVGWFGTRLFDQRVGWAAALATGAAPLTVAFARTVIFDATLTFFVTLALAALYHAVDTFNRDAPHAHTNWVTLGWAAIALGVLTKGPVALVLPLIVIVPFALWRRRARALFDLVGGLLFVAMLLPWILVMSDAAPGFLRHSLVTESLRRFGTTELQRTGPWWYFLPILFAGALPWSIPAVARAIGWLRRRRQPADPRFVFLAMWILVPLVFFSVSQSKRVQYVLPLIPAVALIAARIWTSDGSDRLRRMTGAALLPLAVVLLAAPVIVDSLLDVSGGVAAAIPGTALGLGAALAVAAVGVTVWPRRAGLSFTFLLLPAAAIPVASPRLMDAIGADRSSRAMAEDIRRALPSRAMVIGVHAYPLSLPYYLRQPLTLSSADGGELTSNYLMRTWDAWADLDARLKPPDWWFEAAAECDRPTAFVVKREHTDAREILARRLPLIHEDRKYAAYGPCQVTDLATRNRTP